MPGIRAFLSIVFCSLTLSACGGGGGGGGGSSAPPPPANRAPSAQAGQFETNDVVAITDTLQASDPDGDSLTFSVVQAPSMGAVTIDDAAAGTFTYTPAIDADGSDTFTFQVSDGSLTSSAATITIDITGWPDTVQFGTSMEDAGATQGLIQDETGNVYIGGSTMGVITGSSNAGSRDEFVQKRDVRGDVLWTIQTGTAGADLVRSLHADPLASSIFMLTRRDIRKLDETGLQLWAVTPVTDGQYAFGANYRSHVDASGDVNTVHLNDSSGSFVEQYSGIDGQFVWGREMEPGTGLNPWIADTAEINVRGIDSTSDGGLVLSGGSEGSVTGPCTDCGFVAKLDGDGNDIWLQSKLAQSGTGCTESNLDLHRVRVADDDSIYVSGMTSPAANPRDFVLVKFDANGSPLWTYCDPAAQGSAFALTEPEFLSGGDIISLSDRGATPSSADTLVLYRHTPQGDLVWRTEVTVQDSQGVDARLLHDDMFVDAWDIIFVQITTSGDVDGNSNAGEGDVAILRFDADGNRITP